MSINTIEDRKFDGSLPALTSTYEPRAVGNRFFDALSQNATKRVLFLVADTVAIGLTNWAALIAAQRVFRIPPENLSPPGYAWFYLPFLLLVLRLNDTHQSPDLRRPEKELAISFRAVSLSFVILVCANFIFFKELGFSRYLFVGWYLLALAFVPAFRLGLKGVYGAMWRRGRAQQRAVWVGCAEKLAEFESTLSIQRHRGYQMVGVVPAPESADRPTLTALIDCASDTIAALDQTISELRAQLVVVCIQGATGEPQEWVRKIICRCKERGIDVEVYSDPFANSEFSFELDDFSGCLRFYALASWVRSLERCVKASLDFAAGLTGSLLTALVLPIVGLIIKLEDGGPIFYRSAYVAADGTNRYYLKFRTMRIDADQILERDPEFRKQFEATCKLKRDPRVTGIGRFLRKYSVDEFPSFFSILRGHISLVGPRTIMQMQKEKYGPNLPKLLAVKPGLTGFWQVMGRQLTTHEERVQMDMFYIDHWSIWLDLWIIGKTFWKVLRAEGAY